MLPAAREVGEQFVNFLNKAVSAFHAVEECSRMLTEAGFKELKESDTWDIQPEHKYFVTRNKSCIVAFAVGGAYKAGNGISMIAAHTDSPCLKVKPISKLNNIGYLQVGVSTYGGGLWRTWFDRDLTVAGRVIVQDATTDKLLHKLVHIQRPILHIPNLAIHLESDREKFVFNKEDHLKPILATQIMEKLNNGDDSTNKETGDQEEHLEHHHSFLNMLAEECEVQPGNIIDFDLNVVDNQLACLSGLYKEFVSGGRLDNLVGTYTAIAALINSCKDSVALKSDTNIRIAACYDNEECGSNSAQGADTSFTVWILKRLHSDASQTAFEESIAKSYLISADQAHAVHPNYKTKHEELHRPAFHSGVVVKVNYNQRYATTAITHAILKKIAEKANVKLQKFVVRNDSPCGSTIGPILASKLGMQTIDVGTTQLAMHSVRELADITGIRDAQSLYTEFYKVLPTVLETVSF